MPSITVAIPNFMRICELQQLLDTIGRQTRLPDEVLISDDCSPNQAELAAVIYQFSERHPEFLTSVIFKKVNEGYDANLRTLIASAKSDYVLFIGNDDLLHERCIEIAYQQIAEQKALMFSRTFLKFTGDSIVFGISRLYPQSGRVAVNSSAIALKLTAYIGGIIVDRRWAHTLDTSKYDGTLYYQVYLSLHALTRGSLAYIDFPIVLARSDAIPLFGQNSLERVHTPGRYSAAGRIKMWNSLIKIEDDVLGRPSQSGQSVIASFRSLISGRFSFHIFESYCDRDRKDTLELYQMLISSGYWRSIFPHLFFSVVYVFGSYAKPFFTSVRYIFQRRGM